MDTTQEEPTVANVLSMAQALQAAPMAAVHRHAAWQLAMVSNHAVQLILASEDLKRRGVTLSPALEALLQTFKMLVAGKTTLGITLPASALHLPELTQELAGELYSAPQPSVAPASTLTMSIEEEPIVFKTPNVVTVDFTKNTLH